VTGFGNRSLVIENTVVSTGSRGSNRAPFVAAISSGKGGVGKTLSTINIGMALGSMGHKVLILDGDLGLANVDVILGLTPTYTVEDVFTGRASLQDTILDGPYGLRIIPSGSGVSKLAHLSYVQRVQLLEQIDALTEKPDVLLIDTGAGISENVLHLSSIADYSFVVTTPEPHAMTDAYAFIKVMCEENPKTKFKLIVNMTRSSEEGQKVAQRIQSVAKDFLGATVDYVGAIPDDPQMQKNVALRRISSETMSKTNAGQAWYEVAREIVDLKKNTALARESGEFWRKLILQKSRTLMVANT